MRIGVDLGGTKIEAIVLDKDGTEIARKRVPAPRNDYKATIGAICDLIASLNTPQVTIGVGMPGSHNPRTRLVQNANSTWLNDKPFEKDLAAALGQPVRTANDANCFALSEAVDGAAKGAHSVFGVILGTGVGGGIVIDQRPIVGAHAIAGEWGHLPLPHQQMPRDEALPCFCGLAGCIETYLSGPAMARAFHKATGRALTATQIAAASDREATTHLDMWLDRLARGLSMVVNIIDPEIIVFGGGLSKIAQIYTELPGRLASYAAIPTNHTRILKNIHGDSSGVRGAAWLWDGE
ncbi:MAG: ROK family protein [Alphaproteobacteria bacterium]